MSIDEAFEVAELLQESLDPLQDSGLKEATWTQCNIFAACEKWWHGEFKDRDQLVVPPRPLLLVKSLDDNAERNAYAEVVDRNRGRGGAGG